VPSWRVLTVSTGAKTAAVPRLAGAGGHYRSIVAGALSERLDPEDVARIQEEFFARAAATLTEHGGGVEKYIGDAVMATFGVAVASDDDAVRAVHAATGLRLAARQTEAPLGLLAGTLDLRVGVNPREVVVWSIVDGWRVTGDVVNTAAHLRAAAAPGEVLLGPETAFGVAQVFALEPAGEVTLRGKARAVPVWRPAGRHAVARRGLAALGLRAPTLGRQRIFDELLARVGSPSDGGGLTVTAPARPPARPCSSSRRLGWESPAWPRSCACGRRRPGPPRSSPARPGQPAGTGQSPSSCGRRSRSLAPARRPRWRRATSPSPAPRSSAPRNWRPDSAARCTAGTR